MGANTWNLFNGERLPIGVDHKPKMNITEAMARMLPEEGGEDESLERRIERINNSPKVKFLKPSLNGLLPLWVI